MALLQKPLDSRTRKMTPAGEPAPFWRENVIAVVNLPRIWREYRSDGNKLSNVKNLSFCDR